MSWRTARSLDVLLDEVNTAAPHRSKISDGSIGDAAHATRTSDHNPWVRKDGQGIVRARDFTHDPADGCHAGDLAEAIRQLAIAGHPALADGAYIIWNHQIASATYGWRSRPYYGSNPHTQHCHVSVTTDPDGFDTTTPWGVMNNHQEDQMQPEDFQRMREIVREELADAGQTIRIKNPEDPTKSDWSLQAGIDALYERTRERRLVEIIRKAVGR